VLCLCVLTLAHTFSQWEVLHRSSLAYNVRVLETGLHRRFKESLNRLWQLTGAGSYHTKPEDIQVHSAALAMCAIIFSLCLSQQYQQDNALISSLFIVYAPLAVADDLLFTSNLPRRTLHTLND
jgi:hypothetical protein